MLTNSIIVPVMRDKELSPSASLPKATTTIPATSANTTLHKIAHPIDNQTLFALLINLSFRLHYSTNSQ